MQAKSNANNDIKNQCSNSRVEVGICYEKCFHVMGDFSITVSTSCSECDVEPSKFVQYLASYCSKSQVWYTLDCQRRLDDQISVLHIASNCDDSRTILHCPMIHSMDARYLMLHSTYGFLLEPY